MKFNINEFLRNLSRTFTPFDGSDAFSCGVIMGLITDWPSSLFYLKRVNKQASIIS